MGRTWLNFLLFLPICHKRSLTGLKLFLNKLKSFLMLVSILYSVYLDTCRPLPKSYADLHLFRAFPSENHLSLQIFLIFSPVTSYCWLSYFLLHVYFPFSTFYSKSDSTVQSVKKSLGIQKKFCLSFICQCLQAKEEQEHIFNWTMMGLLSYGKEKELHHGEHHG